MEQETVGQKEYKAFMQGLRVELTEAESDRKCIHRRWGSGGYQSPWRICDISLLELNPKSKPRALEPLRGDPHQRLSASHCWLATTPDQRPHWGSRVRTCEEHHMGGVAKKGGERFLALFVLVLSEEQRPSFADDCLGVAPTKRKGEKRWGEGELKPVCLLCGMAVSAEATKAFSRNGRTQRAPGWPSRETVTLMLGNFPGSS